jgi:hypothetical protein
VVTFPLALELFLSGLGGSLSLPLASAGFLHALLFGSVEGRDILLRNVSVYSGYTALQTVGA